MSHVSQVRFIAAKLSARGPCLNPDQGFFKPGRLPLNF